MSKARKQWLKAVSRLGMLLLTFSRSRVCLTTYYTYRPVAQIVREAQGEALGSRAPHAAEQSASEDHGEARPVCA